MLAAYGCVVTWGLSEAQERERLEVLVKAGCAQEPMAEHEVDDFGYTHAPGHKAGLAKDIITLETLDVREKLAVSFALAQSVKPHAQRLEPPRRLIISPVVTFLACMHAPLTLCACLRA